MKDYSNNFIDARKFILSYKIESEKIVAKLASGEEYVIPYTEDNENKILSKMEEQAKNAKPKKLQMIDKFLAIIQPLLFPIIISNFIKFGGLYYGIVLCFNAIASIYYPTKVIKNSLKNNEIKKLNYFFENKNELNENIDKSENLKNNLSKKAIREINKQESENKEPFTINTIDSFRFVELKILKDNIERMREFGFIEESPTLENKEEKGRVYKRGSIRK